jgi:hypothetical protein
MSYAGEEFDEVPSVEKLPYSDVSQIYRWIQGLTGLVGEQADQARGVV